MKSETYNSCSLEAMRGMAENSVDSIVTDPPYELGFMGKAWDKSGIAYNVELWREALRVLKPGGHLLAFSGTRTYHRLVCAIEDAGFEIRDQIQWIYGSGFPKSHNVSKAIDSMLGIEQEKGIIRTNGRGKWELKMNRDKGDTGIGHADGSKQIYTETLPTSDEAKQWEGFGTALKPANEPICLARKPLSEKTVAQNVLKWGTGAINIDGCRVEYQNSDDFELAKGGDSGSINCNIFSANGKRQSEKITSAGRFPANVIHDGSDEVEAEFAKYGETGANGGKGQFIQHSWMNQEIEQNIMRNKGTAARFFYCAKTSKSDRNEGCENLTANYTERDNGFSSKISDTKNPRQNHHPTVKPTELMRYLCRLVTPPNGIILDPFMGSGSTGKAAIMEGFQFIGIELVTEYFEIAKARIARAEFEPKQAQLFPTEVKEMKQAAMFA